MENKIKINIRDIQYVHALYSAKATITNNNMPNDSVSGLIGWLIARSRFYKSHPEDLDKDFKNIEVIFDDE